LKWHGSWPNKWDCPEDCKDYEDNEKTVKVGRDVELRKGYMKEDAIWGKIVEVHIVSTVYIPIINIMDELFPIPANSPLWNEIREYNTKYPKFVVFKIEVKKGEDDGSIREDDEDVF
jgi:hypothetical protein